MRNKNKSLELKNGNKRGKEMEISKNKVIALLVVVVFMFSAFSLPVTPTAGVQGKVVFMTTLGSEGYGIRLYENQRIKVLSDNGMYPRWSLEGNKIAFLSQDQYGYKTRIKVFNQQGKQISELQTKNPPKAFAWFPKGNKLAVIEAEQTVNTIIYNIVTYNVDSGERKQITQYDGGIYINSIDVAPNGNKILFSMRKFTQEHFDSYVMNADGTEQQLVYKNATSGRFSPNGKKAAFVVSAYRSLRDLYVYDFKTERSDLVGNAWGGKGGICFSPEGDKILFSKIGEGAGVLYELDINKKQIRKVLTPAGLAKLKTDSYPDWSATKK